MHEFSMRWDPDHPGGDELRAWGRNGMSKCGGVDLFDLGSRVIMRPVTGKGFPKSGCSIDLPADPAKLMELAKGIMGVAEAITAEQARKKGVTVLEYSRVVDEGLFTVLDVASGHLSEASCDWLQDREYGPGRELPVVAAGEYGWLLWVPGDEDLAQELEDPDGSVKDWPDDVWRLLAFARWKGCDYALVDADGRTWEGLWHRDEEEEVTLGTLDLSPETVAIYDAADAASGL